MINLSNVMNLPVKQNYNVKNKQEKTNLTDCSKNNNSPILASPKSEHLKANYLTFGVNVRPKTETKFELPPFVSNMLSEEELSNQLRFKPYEKTADFIAQNCFKGDNTLLAHAQGAMPDLAANNFAGMLAKGKFKNLGMTKENTEVYYVDTEMAIENINVNLKTRVNERINKEGEKANVEGIITEEKQKPDQDIQKIQMFWHKKAEIEKKTVVVFVSDPTIMTFKPSSPNIKTVSFAPLQQEMSDDPKQQSSPFSPEIEKLMSMDPSISMLALPCPGAPETKSFLKANKDALIHPGLPPGLIVSDKAIDKAVNMTKEKSGSYPGKAINFIFDATPAALMKKHIKKDAQYTVITPKNLDKAVSAYPELFEEPGVPKPYNLILDTKIKLKDIGGIEYMGDFVTESIINKVGPRKTQDAPPNSVIISGDPGSGKTFLAKAIAGEANSPFIATSALKLVGGQVPPSEIFDYAKSVAKDSDTKTAFLYIDDFDILAADPKSKSEIDIYRTEIFDEIKKIDNKNSDVNVVVLASSEDAKIHQDEFSKKGVFDNKIQTPDTVTSKHARISTIKLFSKDLKFENEESKEKIIQETAKVTEGASGAELKTIIHKAGAIAERRKENKNLTINDVYSSLLELEAGPVTQSEEPDWDKEGTIKHELAHAVTAQTLFNMSKDVWKRPNEVSFITFDPRGNFAGMVSFLKGENGMHTFDSVIAEMACGLGSIYAEKMLFKGRHTHGPGNDIEQTNTLANVAVKKLGLGHYTKFQTSPSLVEENKKDITLLMDTSSKVAEMVIDFNKDFINEYGDECFDKLGKGGNTMSAEVFKDRYNQWLDKDDRREKLKLVEAKIEVLTDTARDKGKFINNDKQLTQIAQAKLRKEAVANSKKA